MERKETVVKNFRSGPRIKPGLVQVVREITTGSVNTAQAKQEANEAYYQAIKKIRKQGQRSQESNTVTTTFAMDPKLTPEIIDLMGGINQNSTLSLSDKRDRRRKIK